MATSFRYLFVFLFAGVLLLESADAEVFELRTYTTKEGKLDALNARFRDHTVRLFQKHGIESVGYWVPTDKEKSKNTLIYVIKHKSRDAAKASWKAFLADPEWKKAAKESGVGGLATAPESVYMELTDYSPEWNVDSENAKADEDDVFELRVYQAAEGKLGKLDARFRDHTIRLFDRHGIKSVAYWHATDEPDASNTLIYVVKHESRDAAKSAWKSFGGDSDWKQAAKASGVGRLAKPPESTYMSPTDYSAIR
ncbi:MAG: NIPSNAP family protein [Rubripirellula sp.]